MANYTITVSPAGLDPQTTYCTQGDTCTFKSSSDSTYSGSVEPHDLFKHDHKGRLSATPSPGTEYRVRDHASDGDYAVSFVVPDNTTANGTIHVGSSE
jgi:hypothetical protein